MPYINQFFEILVKEGASDLHIGEGQPPKIRKHGDVMAIRETPVTREEAVKMLSEISGPKSWKIFEERGDFDFAYEMDEQSLSAAISSSRPMATAPFSGSSRPGSRRSKNSACRRW